VGIHRDVIYGERRFVLREGDPRPIVGEMIAEKVQEVAQPVSMEDGRKRRDKAVSGFAEMFSALRETFPDDITRRMLRSILAARIAPLVEEGETEAYAEELNLVAQEAYEGALQSQLKNLDEKLQDFYHIGDVYYETAGQGTLDYNKLTRTLGLPTNVVNEMRDEEMQYEDALEYLTELLRAGFESQQSNNLHKLQEFLTTESSRPVADGQAEPRTLALLEVIDSRFALSPTSAARFVEAESGAHSSSMMAADGASSVVGEVQSQLEVLYEQVEQTLGEVFLDRFFLDTVWTPLFADQHFGIWALVSATVLTSAIALFIAVPLGLVAAIYLSEFASKRAREILKPVLEVLAGVPTVVYGFFALTVITPALKGLIPELGTFNSLSAGMVMGFMILPLVASLSEDAMAAVTEGDLTRSISVEAAQYGAHEVHHRVGAAASGVSLPRRSAQ
jgi:hypothetical protein